MKKSTWHKIPADYCIVLFICISFVILALFLDTPAHIIRNLYKINTSRSVLVTDYVALAGVGAALVNSAILGFFYFFLIMFNRCKPNGKIVAALFVTMGFTLFGKNLFNTLPILAGVWLYSKFNKVKFSDLMANAMLSATISPLVSEIAFLDDNTSLVKILAAYGVGLFVGFVFPVITESAKRMHRGYCLYNSGTAGGFIATFFVGLLRSVGIDILPEHFWDTSHTFFLSSFAYALSAALIIFGIAADRPANAFKKFRHLLSEKDRNDNDYLAKYGNTCYINIGVMCFISTSAMLFLKIPVNGPVLGGILTVAGFAAAGKHPMNTIPVLFGSIVAAFFNLPDVDAPMNALAILFSTGLAPIAGKHGWQWGIVAGFLHVSVAIFIGQLNGGLNLYNNGFAGAFVAIMLVPLIVFFKDLFKSKNKH